MAEMKREDVMSAFDWQVSVANHIGTVTISKDSINAISALLREKDALIEDYRQELGRARVALNDANAEIARLREIIVKGDYSSYTARLVTETWHRNNSEFIRRLEAEIERLSHHCDDCAGCTQWKCDCSNIRAEAIDEFAHRLKKFYGKLGGKTVGGSVKYHIDQIAKEMKEVEQ